MAVGLKLARTSPAMSMLLCMLAGHPPRQNTDSEDGEGNCC